MRAILPAVLSLLTLVPLFSGQTLRFNSPDFSFLITEPDEWAIDASSAAQIAHFVVYPQGQTWRSAEAVIFARFVTRGEKETAEEFIREDEKDFRQRCPLGEIKTPELSAATLPGFQLKSYACPGAENELVAITPVPSYFAVFVLSTKSRDALKNGLDPFRQLVTSFHWLPRPEKSELPSEAGSDHTPPL